MIEAYFSKTRKRKPEDDDEEMCNGNAKKFARKEPFQEQTKLHFSEDKQISQNDICALVTHLPELKWRHITAENLNLSYALMFSSRDSREIFDHLEKEIIYENDSKIQVHGKWHGLPRKQASYGDPGISYTFSGRTVSAREWTPFLRHLRDTVAAVTGNSFNFVLVNRYKDGNDHIGEHKDDERDLVQKSPIASLSFGEARDFVFRHQDARGGKASRKIEPVRLQLQSGSILMMNYPTNSFWYHSLPIRKKCLGPRINLTFRHMH